MRTCDRTNNVLLYVGCALVLIGVVFGFSWPFIYERILVDQLTLSPTSKSFEMWKGTPIPLYIDFYFFNWTNPEEIENRETKPRFEQVGPYRFREERSRIGIEWNDNGTISYQQRRYWYFEPEASNGTLDDVINTLNVVSTTAVYQTRTWSYLMQKGISLSLSTVVNKIYVTRRINELLFEGYEDIIIDMARNMPSFEGIEIPPLDRFGWFYARNGSTTTDGSFTMETGANGIDALGRLERWNNSTRTPFFGDACGDIVGSAGDFWPPNRTPDSISIFSPDMCRSLTFEFERETEILGIGGYQYSGGESIMDNGTLHPENKCFCNGDCVPSGAVNVSACRFGAPAFVSFPHFYTADPVYRQMIDGMSPDEQKHKFFITLEPKTGIPLEVAARLQINILLQPSENVGLYHDMPKLFIPVLWFEQHVVLTEELAGPFRMLLGMPTYVCCINVALITIGAALLVVTVVRKIRETVREARKDMMIERWGNGGTHTPMIRRDMATTKNGGPEADELTATIYSES